MPRPTRVSTLEPCQCCVLPYPARSRSKGVPTALISASMPRLPRQKLTLSKDLYPSPPEHPRRRRPQDPSQALIRHPRSSHGVLGAPDFLGSLPSPEPLILTLLPLPFAWHLTIDMGDSQFSIEVVRNRSPRSTCSAPARARCDGPKDEGFSLSDEHKLDPLPPLPSALFTEVRGTGILRSS